MAPDAASGSLKTEMEKGNDGLAGSKLPVAFGVEGPWCLVTARL